jgi:hypothetical protein
MFTQQIITTDNIFQHIVDSIKFEQIIKGRQGAIITQSENGLIPLVRSTTIYQNNSQPFNATVNDVITKIKNNYNMPNLKFNNAMVELYSQEYRTMGFHSDQALDLADDSYICIFSCYENPSSELRKLQIKTKGNGEPYEIALHHNSATLFSVFNNSSHLHRIIFDGKLKNNWLGITFRLSKTFIQFINNIPYLYPKLHQLVLATEEEKKEYYSLRYKENKELNWQWPLITYTISSSDIMPL